MLRGAPPQRFGDATRADEIVVLGIVRGNGGPPGGGGLLLLPHLGVPRFCALRLLLVCSGLRRARFHFRLGRLHRAERLLSERDVAQVFVVDAERVGDVHEHGRVDEIDHVDTAPPLVPQRSAVAQDATARARDTARRLPGGRAASTSILERRAEDDLAEDAPPLGPEPILAGDGIQRLDARHGAVRAVTLPRLRRERRQRAQGFFRVVGEEGGKEGGFHGRHGNRVCPRAREAARPRHWNVIGSNLPWRRRVFIFPRTCARISTRSRRAPARRAMLSSSRHAGVSSTRLSGTGRRTSFEMTT
jgi:hypothetical protein